MKAKEQHVDALKQSKKLNKKSIKSNKISQSFKKLTNNEKLARINGAVSLLQHLKEIKVDENQVCVLSRLRIYDAQILFSIVNWDNYGVV